MELGELLFTIGLDDKTFATGIDKNKKLVQNFASAIAKDGTTIRSSFKLTSDTTAVWGKAAEKVTGTLDGLRKQQLQLKTTLDDYKASGGKNNELLAVGNELYAEAGRRISDITKHYKIFDSATGALTAKQTQLTKDTENLIARGFSPQSKQVQNLNKQYDALTISIDGIKKSSKSFLGELDSSFSDLTERQTGLKKEIQDLIAFGINPQSETIKNLKKDYDNVGLAITKVENSSKSFNENLASISKTAMIVGAVLTATVTRAILNLSKSMVEYAANLQFYQASFEVMLGSASRAAEVINDLRIMAAKTPFEMKDLTAGARTLVQFGESANTVMKTVKVLGDIAQGNNERFQALSLAYAQMSSAGRLLAQDLYQMVNAGFNPLLVMSQKTGRSLMDLRDDMKKGLITTEMVKEAFYAAADAGGKFYQGMERASKTLKGLISTLKDDAAMMGKTFTDVFMNDIMNAVKGLSSAVKWVGELNSSIKAFTGTMVLATAAIGPLLTVIGAIGMGVSLLSKLNPLLLKIELIIGAIALVTAAFIGLRKTAEQVRLDKAFADVSSQLKTAVDNGADLEKTIIKVANETGLTVGKVIELAKKEGLVTISMENQIEELAKIYEIEDRRKASVEDIVKLNKTIVEQFESLVISGFDVEESANSVASSLGVSVTRVLSFVTNSKLLSKEQKDILEFMKGQTLELEKQNKAEAEKRRAAGVKTPAEWKVINEALDFAEDELKKAAKLPIDKQITLIQNLLGQLDKHGIPSYYQVYQKAEKALADLLKKQREYDAVLEGYSDASKKAAEEKAQEETRLNENIKFGVLKNEEEITEARIKYLEKYRDALIDIKVKFPSLWSVKDQTALTNVMEDLAKLGKLSASEIWQNEINAQEAILESQKVIADEIKNTADITVDSALRSEEATLESQKVVADAIKRTAKETIETVLRSEEAILESQKVIADEIKNTADEIVDSALRSEEAILESQKVIADEIKNTADEIVDSALRSEEAILESQKVIADEIKNTADITVDSALRSEEATLESQKVIADEIKRVAKETIETTLLTEEQILESQKDVADEIKNTADITVDTALRSEEAILESQKTVADETKRLAKEKVETALLTEEQILENQRAVADETKKLAEETWQNEIDTQETILENQKTVADETKRLAKEKVETALLAEEQILESQKAVADEIIATRNDAFDSEMENQWLLFEGMKSVGEDTKKAIEEIEKDITKDMKYELDDRKIEFSKYLLDNLAKLKKASATMADVTDFIAESSFKFDIATKFNDLLKDNLPELKENSTLLFSEVFGDAFSNIDISKDVESFLRNLSEIDISKLDAIDLETLRQALTVLGLMVNKTEELTEKQKEFITKTNEVTEYMGYATQAVNGFVQAFTSETPQEFMDGITDAAAGIASMFGPEGQAVAAAIQGGNALAQAMIGMAKMIVGDFEAQEQRLLDLEKLKMDTAFDNETKLHNQRLADIDERMNEELKALGLVDKTAVENAEARKKEIEDSQVDTKEKYLKELSELQVSLSKETSVRRKAEIQEKIDTLKAEREKEEAKEATALADAQWAIDKATVEAKYEKERKDAIDEYDKKKRKYDYDRAVFERDLALAQIAIDRGKAKAELGWFNRGKKKEVDAIYDTIENLIKSTPLPTLATGGIALPKPGGQNVNVAEAGIAEAIIPLNRLNEVLQSIEPSRSVSPSYAEQDLGDIHLVVNIDSKPILQKIFPASRNRTVLIDSGAVV